MKQKNNIQKIDDIWSSVWKKEREGLDFTEPLTIFKFKKFLRPIIDILPYGASVLEVGVGNFQWLLLIRAYRPDLVITGLDFCEASRDFSRKYKINYIHGDARNIPKDSNSFHLVYSWGVIEHLEETEQMLSEHFRLSKEFVIFDVPYKYSLPIMRLSRVNRLNGVSKGRRDVKGWKVLFKNRINKNS